MLNIPREQLSQGIQSPGLAMESKLVVVATNAGGDFTAALAVAAAA